MIKRIQQNIVLEVNPQNCCIALGVSKNYVHVCFMVVYLDSKTSPDAIIDSVLMIVFSYYLKDLLVFHHPFTNSPIERVERSYF